MFSENLVLININKCSAMAEHLLIKTRFSENI